MHRNDPTNQKSKEFRFDFGISFSGFDRELARQLRNELMQSGLSVFFDEDFEHEMIGHDGSLYLRNVYSRECRFCVVLISHSYDMRDWTNLERESIQSRELQGERGALIPVLVEDYQPPWLPLTRIRFDLWKRSLPELVALLIKCHHLSYGGKQSVNDWDDKNSINELQAFLDDGWHISEYQAELLCKRLEICGESLVPLLEEKCRNFNWSEFVLEEHAGFRILPRLLAQFRSPTSVDVLSQSLANQNAYCAFRWEAALALGAIGTSSATKSLISASYYCDSTEKWTVVQALGLIHEGKEAAIERLKELLNDADESVRANACRSLEMIAPYEEINDAITAYQNNELLLGSLETSGVLRPGQRIELSRSLFQIYDDEDTYLGMTSFEHIPQFVYGLWYWNRDEEDRLSFDINHDSLYDYLDIGIDYGKWSQIDRWKWQVLYDIVGLRKDWFSDIHFSITSVSIGYYHLNRENTDLHIARQADCPYELSLRWADKSIRFEEAYRIMCSIDAVFIKLRDEYLSCLELHKLPQSEQPKWILGQSCRLRAHNPTIENSDINYIEMEKLYNEALKHEPNSCYTLFELAMIQRFMGRNKKAKRTIKRAIEIDSGGYLWLNKYLK